MLGDGMIEVVAFILALAQQTLGFSQDAVPGDRAKPGEEIGIGLIAPEVAVSFDKRKLRHLFVVHSRRADPDEGGAKPVMKGRDHRSVILKVSRFYPQDRTLDLG